MLQLDTENLNTILEIVQAANVHLDADSLRKDVLGVILISGTSINKLVTHITV